MQFPIHISYRVETCYLLESYIIAYISKKYLLLHLLIYYHDMCILYSREFIFYAKRLELFLLFLKLPERQLFYIEQVRIYRLLRELPIAEVFFRHKFRNFSGKFCLHLLLDYLQYIYGLFLSHQV